MQEAHLLKRNLEIDEANLYKKYENDVKLLEQALHSDIEYEKNHLNDLLEVEIGKLKEETENKIAALKKSSYQNLEQTIDVTQDPELQKRQKEKIELELAKEMTLFKEQCKQRRQRFDQQMALLLKQDFTKRIEFLKKAIVPLIDKPGVNKITDETILETRHSIKINRSAIISGPSYAVYKANYNGKPVMCRISVLAKIPLEIKKEMDMMAKCRRFLCESPPLPYFMKLYDIFATQQKIYFILEELNPLNMHAYVYQYQRNNEEYKKYYRQILEALKFMHKYAIGHLNIKLENVMFSSNNDIKLTGLGRAFCYFNLDQEKIIQAPKLVVNNYNEHCAPECFENSFDPLKADVWSFGLLIYEAETRLHPRKQPINRSRKRVETKTMLKISHIRAPVFYFDKVHQQELLDPLQRMVELSPYARASFDEIQI